MTNERPRASQARQSMMRGMTVPPRPTPQPVLNQGGEVPVAAAAAKQKPALSKFTANLDADTAAEFDGLALAGRRKLGRKVDKSDVLRAFIRLAADDASLRDQIISEIEKGARR